MLLAVGLFKNLRGSDNIGSEKFQPGGNPLHKFSENRRFCGRSRPRHGSYRPTSCRIKDRILTGPLASALAVAILVAYGANGTENVELSNNPAKGGADSAAAEDRMAGIKARVRKTYPGVRQLSVAEFAESGADKLLVDVRAQSEYSVSRIPGAVHIDDSDALLAYAKAHPEKELVLYCSVGMRSSKAAAALQKQGIKRVANLEGSIFQWANDRRPLVDANGATEEVHPYNAFWGWRYLD